MNNIDNNCFQKSQMSHRRLCAEVLPLLFQVCPVPRPLLGLPANKNISSVNTKHMKPQLESHFQYNKDGSLTYSFAFEAGWPSVSLEQRKLEGQKAD